MPYVALVAAIAAGCAAQLLLQTGARAISLLEQVFSVPTIGGLTLYALGAGCYMFALRTIPVSIAFPSVSVSYAVVTFASHLLWKTPFGAPQIGGILLIMGGVLLINRG